MKTGGFLIHDGGFVYITGDPESHEIIANNLGTTLKDYNDGKYVPLSEEQEGFLRDNPNVSPEEVFNMEIISVLPDIPEESTE